MNGSKITRRSFLIGAGIAGTGLVSAGLAGCAPAETNDSKDSSSNDTGAASSAGGKGTYIGIADGRGGPLVVRVTTDGKTLDDIEVVSENETYTVGGGALETFPALMVENQSVAIDATSGATITCMALRTAVESCIEQAGGKPSDFSTPVSIDVPHEDTTADIVVIGSGGAGLTAAVRATEAGKKVILLEKLSGVGGTSNFSVESFGSVGDKVHAALGCPMTADQVAEALIKANPNGDPDVLTWYAHNNGKGADWLGTIGAQLKVAAAQNSVMASREVDHFGVAIVAALRAECKKLGIDVRTSSPASEILVEDGAISGVKVSSSAGDYTIATKAVIIASGGYGANKEMVAEYGPEYKDLNYSCSIGNTGDVHLMAEKIGAELLNMDYIRVNFTYTTSQNGYCYYMGCLGNAGAIFVTDEGKRIVNDQGGYGVGPTIVKEADAEGWYVFDDSIVQGVHEVRSYGKLGLYESADTLEELADKIGVDKTNLLETVKTYQGYVAEGKDEEFNRASLTMTFDEPPFYACKLKCRVQGTFGGISANPNTEVLTAEGEVIPGLYAIGECANDGTWGAHPASVNIAFGTLAAENATAYLG